MMNKLPFLATTLARRNACRNNFIFNRRFSTPVDPKNQGNVIDLLSRKGNDGVESRFKFGGNNVKLGDLSEFKEDEKLLPEFDEEPLFDRDDEDFADIDVEAEKYYLTDEEYLQKLADKGELTWPVQRSYILKELDKEMDELDQQRKDKPLPQFQEFDDSETELEIGDDPLTKYYGNNLRENLQQTMEQTETLYLELLNKTVDRILALRKKEEIKKAKLAKVLAKKKEALKDKPRKPKVGSGTPSGYIPGVNNYFEHILNKLPKTHAHYGQAQSYLQAIALNPTIDFKNKVKFSNKLVDMLSKAPAKDTPEFLDQYF